MLSRELLKTLRAIEMTTDRLVEQQMAGEYHSVFKGRGIAFDEARPYQPGDDIRHIDWNVTARMREPFIKKYIEERELTVLLLVDMSRSGEFATHGRTKRELMAELAALLAFSAIKNHDRVGLVTFTDRVERFVPAKRGRTHVLRVIREILSFSPTHHQTNLTAALRFASQVARRQVVVFLISDFLSDGYERALKLASLKHDLTAIVVRDPMERNLPDLGLVPFEDAETGVSTFIDTSDPTVRRAFAEQVEAVERERRQLFARLDLDFVELSTAEDYSRPLIGFFRRRARRLSRG